MLLMEHITLPPRTVGYKLKQRVTWSSKQKWGIFLVVLSFVIWGSIAVLPFIELPYKIEIGLALYILSYSVFFLGGILAGKETIKNLKQRFFGNSSENKELPDSSQKSRTSKLLQEFAWESTILVIQERIHE